MGRRQACPTQEVGKACRDSGRKLPAAAVSPRARKAKRPEGLLEKRRSCWEDAGGHGGWCKCADCPSKGHPDSDLPEFGPVHGTSVEAMVGGTAAVLCWQTMASLCRKMAATVLLKQTLVLSRKDGYTTAAAMRRHMMTTVPCRSRTSHSPIGSVARRSVMTSDGAKNWGCHGGSSSCTSLKMQIRETGKQEGVPYVWAHMSIHVRQRTVTMPHNWYLT